MAQDLDIADMHFIRSMPACRFPAWPRYVSGDPKQAASFVCTARDGLRYVQR